MATQAPPAGSPSAWAATAHEHGRAPCACDQQSLGAVPWIVGAAVVLLGLNWLASRKKARARQLAGSR